VEARVDWANGLRGCLTWGIPITILLATPSVGDRYLVIIWPALLTFMGVACWLNARRCGHLDDLDACRRCGAGVAAKPALPQATRTNPSSVMLNIAKFTLAS
jgi:hypothetical protein